MHPAWVKERFGVGTVLSETRSAVTHDAYTKSSVSV
jgi:hypothetical protein